ncbi:MAG TPA: TorF family putative porin [Casimicrobiaceae bacterium]
MIHSNRYTHTLTAIALAAGCAGVAWGQTAPTEAAPAAAPAPAPDWTFSANVGLFSQYVFRGISQTDEKTAIQGGFDIGHKSGFYIGTWASNISWISDGLPDASASMEWDFYGGYKFSLPNDFAGDVGVLEYYYPGSYPAGTTKADTTELYASLGWKFLSVKYSYVVGDKTFGFPDSGGSDYIEGNASYDVVDKVNDTIGKVTLIGHVGHQRYKHFGDFSYTDWKGGVQADVSGFTVGVAVIGTNADSGLYTNRFGKDISDTQVVGFVQKTF